MQLDRPAEALAQFDALLRLAPLERACATGLLGDALDAKSLPAEAFAAYASCNRQLRDAYAAQFSAGPSAFEYARSLTQFCEGAARKAAEPAAENPKGAAGHVFLLGFPRSGTTLLEVVLEGHPDVVSLEEHELLIDSERGFMRRPPDLERLMRAEAAALKPLRAAYWRRAADAGIDVSGKMSVGDFSKRTNTRTVLTPSTAQLVRGLSTEGVGHWRRYQAQLAPVLPKLDPWVKRFYYDA
jgi:hypothetical protein